MRGYQKICLMMKSLFKKRWPRNKFRFWMNSKEQLLIFRFLQYFNKVKFFQLLFELSCECVHGKRVKSCSMAKHLKLFLKGLELRKRCFIFFSFINNSHFWWFNCFNQPIKNQFENKMSINNDDCMITCV